MFAGEVGWLSASIKAVADARVGDTITLKKNPASQALPGQHPAAIHGSQICRPSGNESLVEAVKLGIRPSNAQPFAR